MTVSCIATRAAYNVAVAPPKRLTADDVIDSAEALIRADGLAALSARRVAAALGVSRQVVYTHFDGMHGILEELHRRSGRYLAETVQHLGDLEDADRRLEAAAHAYVTYSRTRPALFELTFGAPVPDYSPSPETTAALQDVFRVEIAGLVRGWHEDNRIGIDEHLLLDRTRAYWSSIHGLVTLERAGHAAHDETDRLVDGLTHTLLGGWRAA